MQVFNQLYGHTGQRAEWQNFITQSKPPSTTHPLEL